MRKGTTRGFGERNEAAASLRGDGQLGESEVSSSRARILDVVPVTWLDQLLIAALELPLSNGEPAIVKATVDALGTILPSYAIGASMGPDPAAGRSDRFVVKLLPPGAVERTVGADPTRLFPGLAFEHVVVIHGATVGLTLHLASDDHEIDPDASPAVQLIERAALVLGHVLPKARSMAASLTAAQRSSTALEQRMRQADKLATFGQVAAGVVHELNNPLTSIVAYSEYLIRKAPSFSGVDSDDIERLQRIRESANRMLRYTRELVNYARPSNSAAGPVVLHAIIDRAIAFCEHVLAAGGVRVDRVYGSDVPTIRAVSEQLVQVFVNLITNACQAVGSSGGVVVITTSMASGYDATGRRIVRTVVEDDGTGIAPEHLPNVFVPFFTTKSEKNGTGLGLSIVKGIIDSHDGEIRVDSQLGVGTRFLIELPQRL